MAVSPLNFYLIHKIHPADIGVSPAFLFDDDVDVGNVFITWAGDLGVRSDQVFDRRHFFLYRLCIQFGDLFILLWDWSAPHQLSLQSKKTGSRLYHLACPIVNSFSLDSLKRYMQQNRQSCLILFITLVMGQICSRDNNELGFSNTFFEYAFEEDDKQLKITHDDHIECSLPDAQKNLNDCEDQLKKSQKLFKDKWMKTDPIILKSLNSQDMEVKCTFLRPYAFLNDSTAGRGKSYKIVNKLDSKSSQVIVRDEALQYFGVFLCYLADNPRLITEILLTSPNTYGIHCLRMNINSLQQPIYIDDYVLCLERLPLFVQPVKGQYMWTCLLEKAWLKVNGNVNKTILKIDPQEVFRAFLSYPMRTYFMKDNEEDDMKILQSTLYNLPSTKGCVITTRKSPKHKIGISGRKNFYLIKTFEFEGKKMYYLRNPCAKGLDFRGKRSEMSKELIGQLLLITKEERIPEGNFVLEQDEMLEQVESFLIVHYQPTSSVVSQLSLYLQEEKETLVELELPRDGYVSLCLHQDVADPAIDGFSPLSHLVISQNQPVVISDLQNLQGSFGARNTYLLENLYAELKDGKYLIRLKKKRTGNKPKAIGKSSDRLVVTAPFSVTFTKDQTLLKAAYDNYLREVARLKLSESRQERAASKQDLVHISYWVGDQAVVYLRKNPKAKPSLKVEVGFSQLKNLRCISDNLQNGYTVIEGITDERLIIFEKIDLAQETRLGKYLIESF